MIVHMLRARDRTTVEPCVSVHHAVSYGIRHCLNVHTASSDGSAAVRDEYDISLQPQIVGLAGVTRATLANCSEFALTPNLIRSTTNTRLMISCLCQIRTWIFFSEMKKKGGKRTDSASRRPTTAPELGALIADAKHVGGSTPEMNCRWSPTAMTTTK